MKRHLQLDSEYPNELINAVAATIKEYYPVGMEMESSEYREYPGIKNINAIISQKATGNKTFNAPWKTFLTKLRKGTKKEIQDISNTHEVCFTSELIVERHDCQSLIHIKKLIFSVSLLGPYFSICGVDITVIKDTDMVIPNSLGGYSAINVVTVSPYKEFQDSFNLVKNSLIAHFPNYHFVPFKLSLYYLKNIKIGFIGLEDGTVHNALFNGYFDNYSPYALLRGNSSYGFEINKNITVTFMSPSAD